MRAIVTGGGSGIGAATAEVLRERGARVIVMDRSVDEHDDAIRVYVTDDAAVRAAISEAARRMGGLDVVVNNAGIGAQGTVEANDDEEWHHVYDVNVVGMVRVARAALPFLRESEAAAIVNTCSVAATAGLPNRALYSASKGAVLSLTLAMAADHVREGIRVNCVCPGTADTPWVQRLLDAADDPEAERAALKARQPMGRLVSARAPFDVFAEGLREGDARKIAALSPSARRGAKLFVGAGRCRTCHSGPNFSDGEFHDIGIAPLGGGRATDDGRYGGLERLLADPFNSASAHSDDRGGEKARALASLLVGPQSWGEFKTPSLRNVANRAPYMHAGQFGSLEEVLQHYARSPKAAIGHSELAHPGGSHQDRQVIRLSESDIRDIAAFLRTLSGPVLQFEGETAPAFASSTDRSSGASTAPRRTSSGRS